MPHRQGWIVAFVGGLLFLAIFVGALANAEPPTTDAKIQRRSDGCGIGCRGFAAEKRVVISPGRSNRPKPWARDVRRTNTYRQCIIDYESRKAGIYKAQNPLSSASGAYQFIDSTWSSTLVRARRFYRSYITRHENHAADAPPWVQDVLAAYAIIYNGGADWTHPRCRSIAVSG